jgi:hypothetical protein
VIAKEVVVTELRNADEANGYAVELTVDGVCKMMVFGISPPHSEIPQI